MDFPPVLRRLRGGALQHGTGAGDLVRLFRREGQGGLFRRGDIVQRTDHCRAHVQFGHQPGQPGRGVYSVGQQQIGQMDFQGRLLPRVRSMLSGPDQADGLADPLKGHAGPRRIGGRVRARQRKKPACPCRFAQCARPGPHPCIGRRRCWTPDSPPSGPGREIKKARVQQGFPPALEMRPARAAQQGPKGRENSIGMWRDRQKAS